MLLFASQEFRLLAFEKRYIEIQITNVVTTVVLGTIRFYTVFCIQHKANGCIFQLKTVTLDFVVFSKTKFRNISAGRQKQFALCEWVA